MFISSNELSITIVFWELALLNIPKQNKKKSNT